MEMLLIVKSGGQFLQGRGIEIDMERAEFRGTSEGAYGNGNALGVQKKVHVEALGEI